MVKLTPEFLETAPGGFFGATSGGYTCNAEELTLVPLEVGSVPSFWLRLAK